MFQRFGRSIASSSGSRLFLLVCRRGLSDQDQCLVLQNALKSRFPHLTVEPVSGYRVLIRDSLFDEMPLELKHDLVTKLLPEDIRNKIIVESSWDIPREEPVDREVKKVHLNMNVSTLPDSSIPDTPQSLLDAAAFYFSNECGPMASGLLERCELLALENFCISNGFSPNCDTAQMDVIDFLRHKLPKEYELGFFGCWAGRRVDRYYGHEWYSSEPCEYDFESTERFCNALFDIHQAKHFKLEEFKKYEAKRERNLNNYFKFY